MISNSVRLPLHQAVMAVLFPFTNGKSTNMQEFLCLAGLIAKTQISDDKDARRMIFRYLAVAARQFKASHWFVVIMASFTLMHDDHSSAKLSLMLPEDFKVPPMEPQATFDLSIPEALDGCLNHESLTVLTELITKIAMPPEVETRINEHLKRAQTRLHRTAVKSQSAPQESTVPQEVAA